MKSIYNEKYIEIITRLRIARTEKGITQQSLAQYLNVPQSFVSKVERCDRRLDMIEFICWVEALGLTIDEVLPTNIE